MINNIVLVGRLTKDPELKYLPSGTACAQFTLAVNRPFTNSQGERQADFINCVVWKKAAENTANFLQKGSLAGVEGRLQIRNFEGNEGKRVYVTEVVANSVQFLDSKKDGQQARQQQNTGSNNQSADYANEDDFYNGNAPYDVSYEDVPWE